MKKITIPETVELKGKTLVKEGDRFVEKDDTKLFSFADFVRYYLDGDPRFNTKGSDVRMGVRLENATWKAAPGDTVELENDDATRLAEVVAEPQTSPPFPPLDLPWGSPDNLRRWTVSRQYIPYLTAIAEAAKS